MANYPQPVTAQGKETRLSPSLLFTQTLLTANPLLATEFQQWSWLPGMGFQDINLWWGAKKKRLVPHEGIDFVQYRTRNDNARPLDSGLIIPSIFSGKIVQIHRDFLAWSLYIKHPQFVVSGRVLHTVFAHLQPTEKMETGLQIIASEKVGTLEQYKQSNAPLHLHLSLAWISEQVSSRRLSWQLLNDRDLVALVNPCEIIL